MPPPIDGILESSLYVDDVPRSLRFYETLFAFSVISDFGDRGCALVAGPRHVLLLFKKGASHTIQSPHDGDGELHLAFAIAAAQLAPWEAWLAEITSPSKSAASGLPAVSASTFATPTATCSNSPPPASGPSTE